MGADLFDRFPDRTAAADAVLGYSIRELCLDQDGGRLVRTELAQPALFLVNALAFLARREDTGVEPDFLVGHSLGEYTALFAAGCFDLETGLRIVRKRGELMGGADGGSMLAVLGLPLEGVRDLLQRHDLDELEIANRNGPSQVVLSGTTEGVREAARLIRSEDGVRCLPLNVSGAFHSRHMAPAATHFEEFLGDFHLADPRIPVIANVTARPYPPGAVHRLLARQIASPVRWWGTLRYLLDRGVRELEELGPGRVLTGLWRAAEKAVGAGSGSAGPPAVHRGRDDAAEDAVEEPEDSPEVPVEALGSAELRQDYGLDYSYLAGSMYKGIASTDLVIRMARGGSMGFFGAGGLGLDRVERSIGVLQDALGRSGRYGMNLLHAPHDPELERATVDLYLRHGVRYVEAAGYPQITPPLVRFRFSGSHRDAGGRPVATRYVVGKASRPEVAAAFMRPPPEEMVASLVDRGELKPEEAEVASVLPVSDDLCVEADSGGHTDGGVALTLIPAIVDLRNRLAERHGYPKHIRVGAAGGIGAPEAVAAAFVLGADFVLTGSVNQCSPEAGTSAAVKEMLSRLDIQDTIHAPAGDFELGARVQVVRRGTLFPARATKLYELYRQHESLDEIDRATRRAIEERYFRRSFEEVWREVQEHLARERADEVEQARRSPKRKMALVFKWYFAHSNSLALDGVEEERVNYQIQCGPAIGAFNRSVKGTELEDWRNRHVDLIAEFLMKGGAAVAGRRLGRLAEIGAVGAPP